jgi:hypothetical protein
MKRIIEIIKGFLKKYSSLLLPAGLLLAGLVLFVPTILIGRAASAKKQNWESLAQTLDRLAASTPPKEEAEQIQRVMERYKADAEAVQKMSLQASMRELIKYGIFPKSEDTSSQVYLDFGRRYRAAIEQMITERLKALDAPTDAEIRAAGGGTGAGAYRGGEYFGAAAGAGGLGAAAAWTENPMVNAICNARAERIVMYANPRVFPWYDFWESYQFLGAEQALRDCWYAQTAYWIYEDVVATIEAMNTGSQRVADSPVKRLLGVSFQRPVSEASMSYPMMGALPQGLGGVGGLVGSASFDPPVYVRPGSPSPLATPPWTGRICNEEIDVIHFAVSVIVDSRYTQAFLKELCSAKPHVYREGFKESGEVRQARHNQISILASTFSAVEKQSPAHLYYRYGTDAVMRVDLVCEYVFSRKAYDEIKPEPVKVLLGQSAGTSVTPMGPGGY